MYENNQKEFHMDRKLLDILVCPITKGALIFDREAQELISKSARLAYPIRQGVPTLLPNEARHLDLSELEKWQ